MLNQDVRVLENRAQTDTDLGSFNLTDNFNPPTRGYRLTGWVDLLEHAKKVTPAGSVMFASDLVSSF